MAWTAPRTWVVNDLVTAAMMNANIRDNFLAINPDPATSLPGSPAHGDLALLVDSTTNPTWQFRFRYNANSTSAYKWEAIGHGSYIEGTSSITLPRAGDWYVALGMMGNQFSAVSNADIQVTAGGVTIRAAQGAGGGGTEGVFGSGHDEARFNGLTASTLTVTVNSGSPTRQYIRARPVRVS